MAITMAILISKKWELNSLREACSKENDAFFLAQLKFIVDKAVRFSPQQHLTKRLIHSFRPSRRSVITFRPQSVHIYCSICDDDYDMILIPYK